jgi:hypothetical protein
LRIILIVRDQGRIVIEIQVINSSYASPGAGKKRRRKSSVAHWYFDLKRQQVISIKELKK